MKGTLSESSLLSPPPPFDKPPMGTQALRTKTASLSQKLEMASSRAKAARLDKRLYGSEPCLLEAQAKAASCQRQSQTPIGFRYRSADLSYKGIDKCSRIRARSSEKGAHKSLPKLSYPVPVVKRLTPVKLAVVNSGN